VKSRPKKYSVHNHQKSSCFQRKKSSTKSHIWEYLEGAVWIHSQMTSELEQIKKKSSRISYSMQIAESHFLL